MAHTATRLTSLSASATGVLPGLIRSLRQELGQGIYNPIPKTLIATLLPQDSISAEELIDQLVHMQLAEWRSNRKGVQLLSQVYAYSEEPKEKSPTKSNEDPGKYRKRQLWDLATIVVEFGPVFDLDNLELRDVFTRRSQDLLVMKTVDGLFDLCFELIETGVVKELDNGFVVTPDADLEKKIITRRPPDPVLILSSATAPVHTDDGVVMVVKGPEQVLDHRTEQMSPPLLAVTEPDQIDVVVDGYEAPTASWYKFLRQQFYNGKNYRWSRWLHRRVDGCPFIIEPSLTGSRSPISERKLRTLLCTMEKLGMVTHDEETDWWRWRYTQLPIEFLTDIGDVLDHEGNIIYAWRSLG